MKYLLLLIVLIAVLAYLLNRRGSTGVGQGESSEGITAQSFRQDGPGNMGSM